MRSSEEIPDGHAGMVPGVGQNTLRGEKRTIRSTEFNYPVDIHGNWRGNNYSFITRYGSGFPNNAGVEVDSAFARLDHVEEAIAELRFDVMWHRHNGRWWRLHSSIPLERALSLIESDELLWPI